MKNKEDTIIRCSNVVLLRHKNRYKVGTVTKLALWSLRYKKELQISWLTSCLFG